MIKYILKYKKMGPGSECEEKFSDKYTLQDIKDKVKTYGFVEEYAVFELQEIHRAKLKFVESL